MAISTTDSLYGYESRQVLTCDEPGPSLAVASAKADPRTHYLAALQAADRGDYTELLAFASS